MLSRRPSLLSLLSATLCVLAAGVPFAAGQQLKPVVFVGEGRTFHGDWRAEATLYRTTWQPEQGVRYEVALRLADTHLTSLEAAGVRADKLCVLITAERTFDADGWMRLASDERMSTLLTPTGLAIEGGVQGASTNRYGYPFKSPFDQLVTVPVKDLVPGETAGTVVASFSGFAALPADLPPGLYRLRFDFGAMVGTRMYSINGYSFAARTFSNEAGTNCYYYSPTIPASGPHASGRMVDAATIQARVPWLLLSGYNSNGYRGVVSDEDRHRFATSDRSLMPDDVILPMYDDNGNRLSYSLEPQFPADGIDANQNLSWDWTSGSLSVKVFGPDGSVVDLGTFPVVAKSGNGPTTKMSALTTWRPQKYGRYAVETTGWVADKAGRRYEGGGTYRFWIAKRMTLATATFQGQPYPVGASYGRDIQFNPAVPADVTVNATLFVNSDAANTRTMTYSGKASPAGLFGAAQGMKSFPLSAAGEYWAHVLATFTDADGHLWVSTMRHAGIVYPSSSPVIARGKKVQVGSKWVDRGDTKFEGHVHDTGEQHLAHIGFPYQAGDAILIGAEGQGANKIEPVLTYQMTGDNSAWDNRLNGVGTTNLSIKTSSGYSPHLYPEYITDIEYYYAAAPRPGFMGRFIVGESITRAPYWSVSPNSFGGQIGASPNGDLPGDIYRLLGGVVLRRRGSDPMYAGYIASAFLLPKNSNNNRVIGPGAEDLIGPTGERARFFLVGLRPGTAFEVGGTFRPVLQIDPLVPASITFTLTYPDGRRQTASGTGDSFGYFAGPTAWPLDVPGVYRYTARGTWNGFTGRMPGLPESGGYFFVYSKTKPAGASGIRIDGPAHRTYSATTGTTIAGSTRASKVYYTLLTPGAVIDQGELPVTGGKFQFRFDPAVANAKAPVYDIVSITTGKAQIGRVIHLTFFAEERAPDGQPFFDVTRVILRGTTLLAARGSVPSALAAMTAAAGDAPLGQSEPASPGELVPGVNRLSPADPGALRAWDARVDRLLRDGELARTAHEADTLVGGRTHERMRQLHRGVPIAGADISRQLHNGVAVSLFGVLHAGIDVSVDPAIEAEAARTLVARRVGARPALVSTPSLVVLPLDRGGYALAWQAEARTGTDVRVSFVDAGSGSTLLEYSRLRRQAPGQAGSVAATGDDRPMAVSASGAAFVAVDRRRPAVITTYDLRGNALRARQVLSGQAALSAADVAASSSPVWTDPIVVDAHTGVGAAYDFFLGRFGRRGLDGRDGAIDVVVHPVRPRDWDVLGQTVRDYFLGSFWDGRRLVFGEGLPADVVEDGRTFGPQASALDIVVHEATHAVIGSSSQLINRGESGALAEGFADVMATAAEFALQPAGSGTRHADYLIGEDAVSGGVRSLANPVSLGTRDHVSREAPAGDVHADSTIVSHAYYLAVEGGTHAATGVRVEGVGAANRVSIDRVFYRAWVYLLTADGTFADARAATLQSARDLYGSGSTAERAMTQAWDAVGVR